MKREKEGAKKGQSKRIKFLSWIRAESGKRGSSFYSAMATATSFMKVYLVVPPISYTVGLSLSALRLP